MNKIKIKLRKKSRNGNEKSYGIMIINVPSHMQTSSLKNLSLEVKDLLNKGSENKTNVVLTFTAGVKAQYIRLG